MAQGILNRNGELKLPECSYIHAKKQKDGWFICAPPKKKAYATCITKSVVKILKKTVKNRFE